MTDLAKIQQQGALPWPHRTQSAGCPIIIKGVLQNMPFRILEIRTMLLTMFLTDYYLPSRVILSETWTKNIFSTVFRFSKELDRPAKLADLNTRQISNYLAAYARIWSARSTNDQRQILLMLWIAAYKRKMTGLQPEPELIRKIPEETDPPEAWTEPQIIALMVEASRQHGMVSSIPAADWWLSLFLTIYWTSCRISSMLAVLSAAYDQFGVLVRKQKNNRPQWYPLPDSCREVIDRTNPTNRQLLWEHPWHPTTVWPKARRIIEAAGLPAPHTGRQLFHRLRRTTITMCASVDPAIAQRTAGHQDYRTTERHYIDPRLLQSRSVVDILPDPLKKLDETKSPMFRIYG